MGYISRLDRGAPAMPQGSYIEFCGSLSTDPFAALDKLGQPPIFWNNDPTDIDGYWVATRFDDVRDILQDFELFSSIDAQIPFVQMAEPLLPTETDPPYTQKLRSVLMPFLTAKRVEATEPRMEELCREIIGGFRPNGHCDVVTQFARIYPVTIFMELFGLPIERREEFRQHANIFLHYAERRAASWQVIRDIIEEQIRIKREAPLDDLLSMVATGRIDGELLDFNVAVNLAATLFVGGLDTLPSNIAWGLRFLAQNPDYRRQIIETPEVIPGAVEEFLRLFSVANPMRRVTRNVEYRGANMLAGDRVLCSIAAASRDVSLFGTEISFTRKANPHLAFATGPHRCLGSHLARHELAVALRVWHELIPDYRVVPGTEFKYQGPVFALESLPLEWTI